MLRAFLRTMAVTVALVAIPAVGQACEGGRVLMDDSFTKLNPAWGVSLDPQSEKIDSNGLSVSYAPGGVKRALSQWGFFDNAVACASYTVEYQCTDAEKCKTQPYVGLVVWGRDLANYYTFEVAPLVGIYSVQRLQDNRWLTPVAWSKLPGDKKIASGQKFELSAVVKGNKVTFKLDDQTVAEFEALAPEGGSLVGFELAAAQYGSAKSEISLSRFEVREIGAGG